MIDKRAWRFLPLWPGISEYFVVVAGEVLVCHDFMKRLFLFLAAAALAPICPAQIPAVAAKHSLSLDANVTGSGGASKAKTGLNVDQGGKPLGGGWSTSEQEDFKSSRNKKTGVDLQVEVRNLCPDSRFREAGMVFLRRAGGKR